MTKAEFRERVKIEGRVKSATNLDGYIDSLVREILDDYANKTRYSELLVLDEPVTLVDEQATYPLPADYQNIFELRFGVGPDSQVHHNLSLLNGNVHRRSSHGYPRHYLLSSVGITLHPYREISTDDTLLLSYYRKPSSLFQDDADEFPVSRIENAVLKEVLSRIQRYHNSLSEAQLMKGDAQQSFVAGESGR